MALKRRLESEPAPTQRRTSAEPARITAQISLARVYWIPVWRLVPIAVCMPFPFGICFRRNPSFGVARCRRTVRCRRRAAYVASAATIAVLSPPPVLLLRHCLGSFQQSAAQQTRLTEIRGTWCNPRKHRAELRAGRRHKNWRRHAGM